MGELRHSPDEIKRGLECHRNGAFWKCLECGYNDMLFPGCEMILSADAIALIQQLEAKVPKWISVEDRLPDEENCYLIIMANGFITTEIWLGGQWGLVACGEEVTHWMPLPEPPKEEENHATD